MTGFLALLGAKALYLTYLWLASAIAAAWLSKRKGFGEKAGLATGLLLHVIGVVVWLVWPAKHDSVWKRHGAFKRLPKPGEGRIEAAGKDAGPDPPATPDAGSS